MISLEARFLEELKEIAATRNLTVSELVSRIGADRQHGNLSSAIRVYILGHYRN